MSLKSTLTESLRLAQAGSWHEAHALIDDLDHPFACWLHASLHREEGDRGNAGYWYTRANKAFSEQNFADERQAIAAVVSVLPDAHIG